MSFHQIPCDDDRCADRWHLLEPLSYDGEPINSDDLSAGVPYTGPQPYVVPINLDYPGRRVRFNSGLFDMPIVTSEIAEVLERWGGDVIERYPVYIEDGIPGFEIVNVACELDCVDEGRSYFERCEEDERNGRRGYRVVNPLFIDPARTLGKHVFRVLGWNIALVVSDVVRRELLRFPDLGVVFQPVT